MVDTSVFYILLFIIISSLVGLYIYVSYKTTRLKELAYELIYYYINNCNDLIYYRDKQKHIYHKFNRTNEKLVESQSYWFITVNAKEFISKVTTFFKAANALTNGIAPYFNLNHYFAKSELDSFITKISIVEKQMNLFVSNQSFQFYISRKYDDSKFQDLSKEISFHHNIPLLRKKHNNEFVFRELANNKEYFDTVLRHPLDSQQRESIVKLEDNCLVISSAGSGKTSTSIAKVKYLLEKRHLSKDEILVLSYNRKTADEFQERLGIKGLTCKTYNALALSIIGKAEGTTPDVCESTFLLQCFYNLVRKSNKYKDAITKYIGQIASLTKDSHEYNEAKTYYKDRETYGIMAPYGDMNGGAIFTKSEEEKKICTWLTTHGIDFLYEQPYPLKTADEKYRQYKPDFTIYYTIKGKRYYIFLEHFGIDKEGNVPQWFGEGQPGGFLAANKKYQSGILWKRKIHHENGTLLLETQSSMFHDGTIYETLERMLKNIGVPIRELSADEKYNLLLARNKTMEDNIMNLFSSFINLMKSNAKTFESIMRSIRESGQSNEFNNRCRFLMYEVIKPLYEEYEFALKENGQIDFIDMILNATELCEKKKWQSPYSYILVDEFQDISVDRYKFLKSLRKNSPLTKMYCVGDDWQSIYRFSGSDMNLFNNYERFFGYTERCKIETSYRFGNPLISRSSEFILQNPTQVKKIVKPFRLQYFVEENQKRISKYKENKTELSFIPFDRGDKNSKYLEAIKSIISNIPASESIMLLGRYNYEVNVFPRYCIEKGHNSKRSTITFAGRTMNFMSVHAAKGLEADHVIILNCSQDGGGFPSRISDDPILGYVLSEIDTFEYSEERRLFYVAMTRAKKHTYIMYNENMPSVFVTEMLNQSTKDQLTCPVCKKGKLKVIKEAVAINGNHYKNFVCSNSIAGCRYFWRVFYDDAKDIITKYHQEMDKFFNTCES